MLLLFLAFLGLLATRRWQQLVSPQVWAEDGTKVVYGFISHGWRSFFEPCNGYLIVAPKIISFLALKISFSCYPAVSTILTWLFIASVGLAIAVAPTHLRGKISCAVATFLVPSDPEVFGLPHYSFWWAALLLFLVALWDEKRPLLGWRLLFLVVGGASSPVIILILPILCWRAYRYRPLRSEWIVALVATAIGTVQLFFVVNASASTIPPLASVLTNVIPTFFGQFLGGNLGLSGAGSWLAGVGLVCVLAAWAYFDHRNPLAWTLFYLMVGSIALSVARVDPAIIHPRLAGPRYFFFDFVLTFWILIQSFLAVPSRYFRGGVGVLVVVAAINVVPVWSRRHDDLHWATHVRSCGLFPVYTIPIHTAGDASSVWTITLPGARCADLLSHDLLASETGLVDLPSYPYAVFSGKRHQKAVDTSKLISSTMQGGDYQRSKVDGYRVLGSVVVGDSDTGKLVLSLRRGDAVLYRSGPGKGGQHIRIVGGERAFISELPVAVDWVALEFSNTRLPDEFVVEIEDAGRQWGQWSAVALREE